MSNFPIQWIVIAVAAAIAIWAIVLFNGLIRGRNMVREAWSGIDVQLRRRGDLIPNLVAAVKAYAAHERGLFEDIAAKRAASLGAGDVRAKSAAEGQLQGSLGRLMAVAEAYPELKANQNFLDLQHQLSDIEEQLQMARRYYNGTVRDFNIAVRTLPGALIAAPLGMREEPFFQTDAASAAVPVVNLAGA
jgi:LemA protein